MGALGGEVGSSAAGRKRAGGGGLSSKRWWLLVSNLIPALSLFSPVVLSPKAVSSNWGLQLTRKIGLGDCNQSF